MPTMLSDVDQ